MSNINDLFVAVPPDQTGSISVDWGNNTVSYRGQLIKMGAEKSYQDAQGQIIKARELVDFDPEKLGLKDAPMEEVEEVPQEVTVDDTLAALTDLNDRLDTLEAEQLDKVEDTVEKASLWARIKAVFVGG